VTCLALLATAALAATAPSAPVGPVQIEAGTFVYDAITRHYRGEGGVVLRRGAVVLRARTADLDPVTGEVVATGDVLLTDPTRVIAADGVHAVLGGPFEAENVIAFLKSGAVDLSGATTLDAARQVGRNRLSLTGTSLQGDADGHLQLDAARVTLCDCGGAAPSWELRSRHADVIPGERAILSWPVFRITPRFLGIHHTVPVLILPTLYVPLSDRHTGLLIPQIASSGATGWLVEEPIFVTLGRSWDLTLTPGYAFGRISGSPADGDVRGPTLRSELRWAPAVGTEGRADVTFLHDLAKEQGGVSGDRYAVSAFHSQRLDDRASLRADLSLYGDPVLPRDFTADILARGRTYRRSDLLLDWRGDAVVLEGGAQYLEPLRPGGVVPGERFGTFGSAVDVMHRWPFGEALLLPAFVGPLRVEGRAGVAWFGPASALNGQATPAVVPTASSGFTPLSRPVGVDFALRPPATRGDLRAEVGAPLVLGDALAFEPFVRGAAAVYGFGHSFDASALQPFVRDAAAAYTTDGGTTAQAWAVAGARLSSELSRSFGAVRHRIIPSVEWRFGTAPTGRPLFTGYDLFDRARTLTVADPSASVQPAPAPLPVLSAAPEGQFHQLRLALQNRLTLRGVDVLDLTLGQDVDLELGRAGETFVTGIGRIGPLTLDGTARAFAISSRPERGAIPVPRNPCGVFPDGSPDCTTPPLFAPQEVPPSRFLDYFSELRANATLADRRGDVLRIGILSIGEGASGTLVGGIDPLFDLRPAPVATTSQGTAGARAVLGPATLGYDVLFPGRPIDAPLCSGGTGTRRLEPLHIQQHVASFTWNSPCNCFRVAAIVNVNDCGGFSPRVTIELAGLGAGGSALRTGP
jgi:LPS-assembly protein